VAARTAPDTIREQDRKEEDDMADSERRQKGLEMLKEVYAGDVVSPPAGNVFTDVMLEQVFAEVWSRDVLSIRDRRLLLLGIIAEKGEPMTFGIQAKAALKRGELEPDELRELLLMIAQYAGYPRAAVLVGLVEQQIAEFEKEKG